MTFSVHLHFEMDEETRVKLVHYGNRHPLPLEKLAFIVPCFPDIRRFVIDAKMRSDQMPRATRNLKDVEPLVLENAIRLLLTTTDG
jgi:hypothetical protein